MDAKCEVTDEGGSLTFNPGVDVGLGLSGSLYQDSSPTITFGEFSRDGLRHRQSIDVSLRMTPEAHIAKQMHFKIKDVAKLIRQRSVDGNQLSPRSSTNEQQQEIIAQDTTASSAQNDDPLDENVPLEFHEISWYGTTLKLSPQSIAHKCQTTLFVYPASHRSRSCVASVTAQVDRYKRRESAQDESESLEEEGDEETEEQIQGRRLDAKSLGFYDD